MRLPLFAAYLVLLCLTCSTLTGCASSSQALGQTAKMIFSPTSDADTWVADPAIRYLRVVVDGRVVILALGYLEPHAEGDVEVWYSGTGEVVRLQNGRIAGTSGLATDWREVRFDRLPSWQDASAAPKQFERTRDEMPGYRFNIHDVVSLRTIPPPTGSNLLGVAPQTLKWFEESLASSDESLLPPSRYAVQETAHSATVVYAEQCLSKDLCLTWQRWPIDKGTAD